MRLRDLNAPQAVRAAALLDEALDLPSTDHPGWLRELKTREPELHELVGKMLANMQEEALSTTAIASAVVPLLHGEGLDAELAVHGEALDAELAAPSPAGSEVGPYRIVRLLGQGGMGTVWLAERVDGLFTRQVALKLPHQSLLGTMQARFIRERNILATLTHPLIARLLDAGIMGDGRPYLAMEYIEGQSLTAHCDQARLPPDERIGLVLQILTAVQHAHQRLVIHRDLKPSNIMVTAEGTIHLLDFGIAKLLTDGKAHETELTRAGGRALTMEYASPEQITGAPITTASDVYAIGVVLYELLCGQSPYSEPRSSPRALEDAVLREEVQRPSRRNVTKEQAAARSMTPKQLSSMLSGDLDTIVLKALRKDESERYATAEALMQDLRNFLEGRPVSARAHSAAYRFRKFIDRNRAQVGVALAVTAALLLASLVSLRQAQRAQAEAARATSMQEFLLDIFRYNSDQQPDPQKARSTSARELLDVGAKRATTTLGGSPEIQAMVSSTLADMYHQLGLYDDAARMRKQQVSALGRFHRGDHLDRVDALIQLADDLADSQARSEARAALERAEAMLGRLGEDGAEEQGLVWLAHCEFDKYESLAGLRSHADLAVRHFRRHPGTRYWSNLFFALMFSARGYHLAGDQPGAEATMLTAMEELERRGEAQGAWSVTPRVWLADAQWQAARFKEAEHNLREALAVSQAVNGPSGTVTLQTQSRLAGFLHSSGRRDEGLRLFDATQKTLDDPTTSPSPLAYRIFRGFLGPALHAEGRLAEADAAFRAHLTVLRAEYPQSMLLARDLARYANLQADLGRYDESATTLAEAWTMWQRTAGGAATPAADHLFWLARAQHAVARGDHTAAETALDHVQADGHTRGEAVDYVLKALLTMRIRLQQQDFGAAQARAEAVLYTLNLHGLLPRLPRLEAEALWGLGQARERVRPNAAQGCDELRRAMALRERNEDTMSPWLAEVAVARAACEHRTLHLPLAAELIAQAERIQAGHAELGSHFTAPLKALVKQNLP